MGKSSKKVQESAAAEFGADDIDSLKDLEKEKLAAAESTYGEEVTVSGGEPVEETGTSAGSGKMAWLPGLILIGLGSLFLLNNLTGWQLHNWWALFILIPAIGSFSKAANTFRSEGEMTRDGWGALAGGIIMTLIASAFLFNLNWGLIWPAFLIIGGLGMLLGALRSW